MKPSAKLKDFTQSMERFRRRAGISRAQAADIVARAKQKANLIANNTQLGMLVSLMAEAKKALAAGESLQDFKERATKMLNGKWGPGGSSIVGLVQGEMQQAYTRGRIAKLTEPDNLRAQPFWRYTSILDSRTTEICTACNGTTLPAAHKWWKTHTPPLHFHCRSTIVGVTTSQAKAFGVTRRPPGIKPDAWNGTSGETIEFGKPSAGLSVDVSKLPPDLRKSYAAKVARVTKYFAQPKKTRRKVSAPKVQLPEGFE